MTPRRTTSRCPSSARRISRGPPKLWSGQELQALRTAMALADESVTTAEQAVQNAATASRKVANKKNSLKDKF